MVNVDCFSNLQLFIFRDDGWTPKWRGSAGVDLKKQEGCVLWRKDLRPTNQLTFLFVPGGLKSWLFEVWRSIHTTSSVILHYIKVSATLGEIFFVLIYCCLLFREPSLRRGNMDTINTNFPAIYLLHPCFSCLFNTFFNSSLEEHAELSNKKLVLIPGCICYFQLIDADMNEPK